MLHEQIKQARIEHGLTQSELARRAGIPRDRLRQFENGENITVETLMKILGQLPNLESVTIGAVQARTGSVDLVEVRDSLAEWLESGRKLLTLLERAASTGPRPAGEAPRRDAAAGVSAELESRLSRLEAQIKAIPDLAGEGDGHDDNNQP
jgi:transcriptional regulator with XRE-family HTH domain